MRLDFRNRLFYVCPFYLELFCFDSEIKMYILHNAVLSHSRWFTMTSLHGRWSFGVDVNGQQRVQLIFN
jgi:hypothetical protein